MPCHSDARELSTAAKRAIRESGRPLAAGKVKALEEMRKELGL